MRFKLISLFVSFILIYPNLSGQSVNYQLYDNIRFQSELTNVNCFTQDEQGLIWIGTNRGLYSFDGYLTQQHFTRGLVLGMTIHSMLFINSDILCLGTNQGILFYNIKKDSYESVNVEGSFDVRSIIRLGDILWLGTLDGLYKYNIEKRRIESSRLQENVGLPHKTIYSIIKLQDNSVYVGTYDGFCKYNSKTKLFEKIELPLDSRRSNSFVNSLLEDKVNSCIWIGTEGALYKYNLSTKRLDDINLFHNNSIKSLLLDLDNNLLLGTDNGLYIYNLKTGNVQHEVHDSRNVKSLIDNIIWSIFADKDNNIWLGTDYGVSYYDPNKLFQSIFLSQITNSGNGNRFYSMLKDSQNNYWLGGSNGLIFTNSLTEKSSNIAWYRMGDPVYPISHNRIRDIYEDQNNNIWLATDGSIDRFDRSSKRFVRYNIVDSTHTYNSNWAYNIFEDGRKRLWITAYIGGIFVVDKEKLLDSKSTTYIADKHYSSKNGFTTGVNLMAIDNDGNVWIPSHDNIIKKIDTKTDILQSFVLNNHQNRGEPHYLFCDSQGNLWAGFQGELMKFDTKNKKAHYLPFDNSQTIEVLSIVEENEKLWISTTDGLWVMNKAESKMRRVNLANKSFTSGFYDKSVNRIYWGGSDELVVLSPEILTKAESERSITLTSIYVNDKLYKAGLDYEGNSIRYLDKIKLNYRQNNLMFEFSDMKFSSEAGSRFVCKLEGFDNEWNLLPPKTNKISYSNLEYGDYVLYISRLDAFGKSSDAVFRFVIEITPPWYYTIWAKCIYFVILVALLLWVINFFKVKHNLRIERIEREKTQELTNLKIDFFTNVSHEFKTPLSLIIAPISRIILETKDTYKKRQLESIQRNALKLNSLIRQLLDFNTKGSDLDSTLILSQVEFVEFAKSLFALYEEGYQSKKLHLRFESKQDKIYIKIDVLKIESVLNNLLANACKYTPDEGSVGLFINQLGDEVEIKIVDTGIGIPEDELSFIFDRFYQSSKTAKDKDGTGVGLYLVKKHVEQHGGRVLIDSVEDRGTTVTVVLPSLDEIVAETVSDDVEQNVDEDKPLILVVEDNPEIAVFIKNILSDRFRCKVAHNGKMGLELALKYIPDVIVSDVMMPIMDGLEMSRLIRKNIPTSTIPIIFLTAKDDRNTELESINLKVDAFISKPFDGDILLSRIQQLLSRKQQIKEKIRIEEVATPKVKNVVSIDEKFLSEVTQVIENKIDDPQLNVNMVCEILDINSKQLYRRIKQLTGTSPVEYIRTIRMKKAAMLLNQKKFTVSEVMYMVGFSNNSYFSKCFHTQFGKTPKQYLDEV